MAIIMSTDKWPTKRQLDFDSKALRIKNIVTKKDKLSNKAPKIPTGNCILK